MKNTDVISNFSPRRGLQRTLRYRASAQWMFAINIGLLTFTLLGLVASLAMIGSQAWAITPEHMSTIVILGLTSLLATVLVHKDYQTRQVEEVEVRRDGLILELNQKIIGVQYEEIAHVSYFLLGTHLCLHLKDGREFWFSHHLERAEYLLESVFAHRPDLITTRGLRIRNFLVRTDHAFARLAEQPLWSRPTVFRYLIVPMALTVTLLMLDVAINEQSPSTGRDILNTFFIITVLNAMLAQGLRLSSDLTLSWRTRRNLALNAHAVRRNLPAEAQAYANATKLHYLITSTTVASFTLMITIWAAFPR